MRHVPLQFDVFNAARNAEIARERERQAMYRRPDALPLLDEPAASPSRSLAWIVRLARRRPAARARRAVG
ncbi:MAG TPA: hypothetical protein VFO05_09935 [Candidatus Limnocylindrales bacterium]|nr:hypothetical protein [Candidatus Limnocylindrales bacterium]